MVNLRTRNKYHILISILVILILVLLISNLLSLRYAKKYYSELNDSRLYPLGKPITKGPIDTSKNPILILGDSRAASWSINLDSSNYQILNYGIDGFTTEQLKNKLRIDSIPLHNAIVIIQIGINDLKTIPLFANTSSEIDERTKNNLLEITKLCLAKGAKKIILSTIFPLGKVPVLRKPFWSDEINQSIVSVNQSISNIQLNNTMIFDSYALLEDKSRRNAWGIKLYFEDLLHLNQNGYNVLNNKLVQLIKTDEQ